MRDKERERHRQTVLVRAQRIKCIQGKQGCKQRQGKEKYLQAMPFSSHPCWHSQSALFATVFINSKINMAAALTLRLVEPISGVTYKTGCSGRAMLCTGQSTFSEKLLK